MKNHSLVKPAFYLSLFSAGYFALVFTKTLQNANSVVIGALFELFTIPLVILQCLLLGFSAYQLFVKQQKPMILLMIIFVLSLLVCVSIFLVN